MKEGVKLHFQEDGTQKSVWFASNPNDPKQHETVKSTNIWMEFRKPDIDYIYGSLWKYDEVASDPLPKRLFKPYNQEKTYEQCWNMPWFCKSIVFVNPIDLTGCSSAMVVLDETQKIMTVAPGYLFYFNPEAGWYTIIIYKYK